jgi:hypothetical protein
MTMVNFLLKSTQNDGDVPKRYGFLYDIGCNIEKGIIKVTFSNCISPHHLGKLTDFMDKICFSSLQSEINFLRKGPKTN